jgi:trehalose 6-phosphate phosphatase
MTQTALQPRLPPPALPAAAALFLDFDGTLAPIAEHPDAVEVLPDLPALLTALHERLHGAVAIVTGRRLHDVDRRLAPFVFGGAGLHGAELRRAAGQDVRLQWNPDTRGLVAKLERHFAADARVLVEDKEASVALHFRRAPERAQECRDVMLALVPRDEFEMIAGSMVIEARPRGAGKGRAVRELMRQAPFRGRRPVFVGDDVTDEDGFAAAAELGGYGVKIGPGVSVARYRLDGIADLPGWLQARAGARAHRRA